MVFMFFFLNVLWILIFFFFKLAVGESIKKLLVYFLFIFTNGLPTEFYKQNDFVGNLAHVWWKLKFKF